MGTRPEEVKLITFTYGITRFTALERLLVAIA
jgi:hypothetical protein